MAHRSVLIRALKIPALALLGVILAGNLFFSGRGCAIFHRYPAYRGKVLELGTDRPIEKAGVIAAYWAAGMGIGHPAEIYLGYQVVLTDKAGRFEVPGKLHWNYWPFAGSFRTTPTITIYKKGYGSFPASFGEGTFAKRGKTTPEIGAWVPAETEVIFRMPKLETAEELKEHHLAYVPAIIEGEFPPKGMTREQFEEYFGY